MIFWSDKIAPTFACGNHPEDTPSRYKGLQGFSKLLCIKLNAVEGESSLI